jgi:hypothetical protein
MEKVKVKLEYQSIYNTILVMSGSGLFLKGGAAYNLITGEVDEEMKSGSLGLVFGLGTSIGEKFVISADYNMGMSNLVKGGDIE